MLTPQRHRIRRQVLELSVRDEATAERLRPELGRIQRQRLAALVDRCLTERSTPERLHRIARLEVDLGPVDPERLEGDLVELLGVRLRAALARRLGEEEPRSASRDDEPGAGSRLELLDLFVRSGRLPWWADAATPRLVSETLEHLVAHAARPLAGWLPRLPAPALKRLVLHVDDERLTALCGVLVSPSEPPRARPRDLEALLGARHATPERFRAAVWQAVLRTICRAGSRDARTFWSTVLTRIAVELGTTLAVLVEGLHGVLETTTGTQGDALGTILDRLAREMAGEEHLIPTDVMRRHPEALQTAAPAHRGTPEVQEPTRRLRKRTAEARPAEARPAEARPAEAWPAEARPGDVGTERLESVFTASAFSDADVVYVDNAGLVVLWPFLGNFFEHLGLMKDKAFNDAAAVHRAVGLLQYVVTEDPSPPEYAVTLGKVLCGMDVDEVFDFGPPVTEAEAAECANLLSAAIGHAPILGDMSVPGFRGSFLIRKGVLSVQHGAWLLRVERETYDVVLDRFPWGWSWVKLPFMEAPLRVEW